MAKTLRVCLAMGGGVSLGSFSGSSLTEALKLLVLYGKDDKGVPYDDIVVDGMSGASAGAIALTIMLKCLIDYESMMPLFDAKLSKKDLENELIKDYFENQVEELDVHPKKEQLLALQLAQKIQKKLWVYEVDSLKLFGKKIDRKYVPDIKSGFALLDREILESLTKKYLMNEKDTDISRKQLLADDRVLFACSLTNLLPLELSSKFDNLKQLDKNVLKSIGSQNHSELRVIDFVFNEELIKKKPTDSRWIKFTETPDVEKDTHFNLVNKESWATISASALACGAFPLAFEPVLLKRFSAEYGGLDNTNSSWPSSFINLKREIEEAKVKPGYIDNAFIGDLKMKTLDYEHFNFPYMDGGTFNNEPIREAFKLASFQDYNRDLSNEERLILFVDPIVREEEYPSYKLKSINPIVFKDDEVNFQNEFSKLINSVTGIIGVLANQGSVKEEHKINDLKENLKLRDSIFPYLEMNKDLGDNLTVELLSTAFFKIEKNLSVGIISPGTRNPLQYFVNELHMVCKDKNREGGCLLIEELQMASLKREIEAGAIKTIKEVYVNLNLKDKKDKNLFAQTVFKLIIDFALDTDGKNENAKRAAILPINRKLETIKLPGEEIEAFGGFASIKAKEYAFEYGRLSTILSLSELDQGFRSNQAYIKSDGFISLIEKITNNINTIGFFDKNNNYETALKKYLFVPASKRLKNILIQNKFISFIATKLPFAITGLAASPVLLWKSLFKRISWNGNGFIDKSISKGAKSINYLSLEPINISILSEKRLKERLMFECSDTKLKIRKSKRTIIKIDGKNKYQYYFQVFKLVYPAINAKASPSDLASSNNALFIKSSKIGAIKLSLSSKISLPKGIDGNLYPDDKMEALVENYENLIESIRIDTINLPPITLAINNKSSSLHFCLKNSNSHLNPLIEIDVDELKKGWYFKEQTESLESKLLTN